jgi:hypothetical protein
VVFDRQGIAYLATAGCCTAPPEDIALTTSPDGGHSWTVFRTIYQSPHWTGAGTNTMAVDTSPKSPYTGTLYLLVGWADQLGQNTSGLVMLVSHDHGQTWQAAPLVQVPLPDENVVGGGMAVAADGTVYVAWYRCQLGYYGLCNLHAREEPSVSHDGGQTWSSPTVITPVVSFPNPHLVECPFGVFGILPNTGANCSATATTPQLAVDSSGGPHTGRLYLTFQQWTGSYGGVVCMHSDDQGQSWSRPVVMESDQTHHDHFAPSITVAIHGTVWATWLDRRDDPTNVQYCAYGA